MELTDEQRAALSNYIKSDINLHRDLKLFFNRIIFLSLDAEAKECCAGNEYFAQAFKKDPRTIRRWLKKLQDLKYITIELTRSGKMVIRRTIQIAQELLVKIVNIVARKASSKKPHSNAKCPANVLYNIYNNILIDNKEKKDILYKYNISKKEKISNKPNKSKPTNYTELLKFWNTKNLESNARAFWKYNTKREWADIRNWKRAAIGWDKKALYNFAAFRANKTKDKQTTLDYLDILPDLSYNSWNTL